MSSGSGTAVGAMPSDIDTTHQVDVVAAALGRMLATMVDDSGQKRVPFSEQLHRHGAYFPVPEHRRIRAESLDACGRLAHGSYTMCMLAASGLAPFVDLEPLSKKEPFFTTQFVPLGINSMVRIGGIALDVQCAIYEEAVSWLRTIDAELCRVDGIGVNHSNIVDSFIETTATAMASRISLMNRDDANDGISQPGLTRVIQSEYIRCREACFLRAKLDESRLEMVARVLEGEVELCESLCKNLIHGFARPIPEAPSEVATLLSTIARASRLDSGVAVDFVEEALSQAHDTCDHILASIRQTADEIRRFDTQKLQVADSCLSTMESPVLVYEHGAHRLTLPGFSDDRGGLFYAMKTPKRYRHRFDVDGVRVVRMTMVVARMERLDLFRPGRVSSKTMRKVFNDVSTSVFLASSAIRVHTQQTSVGLPLEDAHRDATEGGMFSEEVSMVAGLSCEELGRMSAEPQLSELQGRCGSGTGAGLEFLISVVEKRRQSLRIERSETSQLRDVLMTLPEVREWLPIHGKLTIDATSLKKRNGQALTLLKKVAETCPGGVKINGGGKSHKRATVEVAPLYLMNLLGKAIDRTTRTCVDGVSGQCISMCF